MVEHFFTPGLNAFALIVCLSVRSSVVVNVMLRLVFRHFWGINFQPFVNYFVWLRITDEGSVPIMRIWSILLIKQNRESTKGYSR